MAQGSDQERTEKATPKRRQEARKKGQVAQSREIPSALILICGMGALYLAGPHCYLGLRRLTAGFFRRAAHAATLHPEGLHSMLGEILGQFALIVAPLMAAVLMAGLAANIAQVGFFVSGEALTPKFSKLNPLQGFKRLFSLRSFVELTKSLLKMGLVGGIAYLAVARELDQFPGMMNVEVPVLFSYIAGLSFKIGINVALALLVLAALDYGYQRWQFEKNMMMTKEEVKEEHKQMEGDPKIKARIRAIQMETARRRMMEAVPEATVVITNPTHYAVALKFVSGEMDAPRVVAKGAGFVAQRIKETAQDHQVPVVEDKPLARSLYASVDLNHFIPVELYQAVAEILAYVYRLRGQGHG
ncbi:MAG: flagellar biosynthesis protein FlhB [Desulfobacterales bacterium]